MTDILVSACVWCHRNPDLERSDDNRYRYECPDSSGVYSPWRSSQEEAAEAWNRLMRVSIDTFRRYGRTERVDVIPECDMRILEEVRLP